MGRTKCSYQPRWEVGHSWLQEHKSDSSSKAWCKRCLKGFSIKSGYCGVTQHQRTHEVRDRKLREKGVPEEVGFVHLSKLMKNGGIPVGDTVTVTHLRHVDYDNPRLLLTKDKLYIGQASKRFITEMKMSCDTKALQPFFLEYFSNHLHSITLKYLIVLSPAHRKTVPLEEAVKMWTYLGEKFSNIINDDEIDEFIRELRNYHLDMNDDGVSQEVDKWWASVAKLKHKEDRSQVFPHLSKLALGLCTVYNSSSPAERDFTVQSHIYADKRVHKLGQKKLVAKTTLRSSVAVAARDCSKCHDARKDKEEQRQQGKNPARYKAMHCHCNLLPLDQALIKKIVDISDRKSKPEKDSTEDSDEDREEDSDVEEEIDVEEERSKDRIKAKSDLQREIENLKRNVHETSQANEKSKEPADNSRKATSGRKSISSRLNNIYFKILLFNTGLSIL